MAGDPHSMALPNHRPLVEIRHHPVKGRGVFVLQGLPPNTLIDISPILLFPHPEYAQHGRHTLLHHYTYRWPGGFALALGLGSIFNHSRSPNVGFVRDTEQAAIRYVTMKQVEMGEELCISYGKNLWFDDVQDGNHADEPEMGEAESDKDDFLGQIRLGDDECTGNGPGEDHSSRSGNGQSWVSAWEPAVGMV